MKIKRFEGGTEAEVIEAVKNELGLDAIVLNIKKIQPKGLLRLFRKPLVEVTAAYDESKPQRFEPVSPPREAEPELIPEEKDLKETQREFSALLAARQTEKQMEEQKRTIDGLRKKLSDAEEMLGKAMERLSVAAERRPDDRVYSDAILQIFYESLVGQDVLPEIAREILDELADIPEFQGNSERDEIDVGMIVKVVYNKMIEILSDREPPQEPPKRGRGKKPDARVFVFFGPTGVGKTTTIAKLSAGMILNEGKKVGFMTADTYRIAAVEQLRIYADILGVPVEVIYGADELREKYTLTARTHDAVFLDTAGRSHRSRENLEELAALLAVVPHSENYLVLSLTTKLEDLLSLVTTYSEITKFKLIFTKLDETLKYGSILNVCRTTGKKVSYVTTGQDVPRDIERIKPEKIAKALLGLGGEE